MVKKVSIWLILEPLLYFKEKHLSEISKKLNKSHSTIRKQLEIFEKEGLIKKTIKGKQTFYKLKKIPLLIDYLTIIEKERLIKKCQNDLVFKELVEMLHQLNNNILIFGSYVESNKDANDIDILIIGKYKKENLEIIEKKLNLNLHIIQINSIKDINLTLKKEIIKKHIIIQNSEKWIKWILN